jgi:hypothetical protein
MMYTLTPDEKATLVMAYTQNLFVRGEAVTKQTVRLNSWLRTQGMPEYIHMLRAQVLVFGGGIKSLSYPEIYVPTASVIAFHLAPPTDEALDYDPEEKNRVMEPAMVLVGTFQFKGKLRVSAQTGLGSTLESSRSQWLSIYEVEVTNPNLPQMPAISVPMILMNPKQVSFALE